MKGVVVPAVLELFPNTSADLEIEIGCYGHIAGLVFAFPILPRNYRRYEAVNNLGPALERPLISLSGPSAKSPTHLDAMDYSVGSVYSPSLAEATVYGYTFLLATPTGPPRSVKAAF